MRKRMLVIFVVGIFASPLALAVDGQGSTDASVGPMKASQHSGQSIACAYDRRDKAEMPRVNESIKPARKDAGKHSGSAN